MRTTVSHPATPWQEDRTNQQFHALRPDALWLSDFAYVATWAGFVYVAFGAALGPMAHNTSLIDAIARRIVGWWDSRSMQAGLILFWELEQALHARRPSQNDGPSHHSDRGSQ